MVFFFLGREYQSTVHCLKRSDGPNCTMKWIRFTYNWVVTSNKFRDYLICDWTIQWSHDHFQNNQVITWFNQCWSVCYFRGWSFNTYIMTINKTRRLAIFCFFHVHVHCKMIDKHWSQTLTWTFLISMFRS